jgi:hypothetical protein
MHTRPLPAECFILSLLSRAVLSLSLTSPKMACSASSSSARAPSSAPMRLASSTSPPPPAAASRAATATAAAALAFFLLGPRSAHSRSSALKQFLPSALYAPVASVGSKPARDRAACDVSGMPYR